MNATRPHSDAEQSEEAPVLRTVPRPIVVLITDDHPAMRRGLRLLLEREPDIEVSAEAGELASTEQLVAEHRPDVLVLDLSMPDGSSLSTVSELRRRVPATQIVVASMDDTAGFAQQSLAAGAIGYVLKEYADEDLAPAIRAAARGEQYLSALVARRVRQLRHLAPADDER